MPCSRTSAQLDAKIKTQFTDNLNENQTSLKLPTGSQR